MTEIYSHREGTSTVQPITYPERGERVIRAEHDESDSEIFHPVSSLFPQMTPAEFSELESDIKTHGQREPIWRYRGQIIDGRHRYRACQELGYEPWYKDYTGEDDEQSLVAFVVSLNLKRRHLNESQRAMIAAKLANMRQGQRTDRKPSLNLGKVSQSKAAQMLNVSTPLVEHAAKVQRSGTPELRAAVESGKVAVSNAAVLADAAPQQQKGILLKDTKAALAFVKQLKERKREEKRAARRLALEAAAEAFTADTATPTPTITIYNLDARLLTQRVTPDVDLVFTSPPYNVGMDYHTHNDNLRPAEYRAFLNAVFTRCWDVMKPGARIGINVPFGVDRDPYRPIVPILYGVLGEIGFTLIGQTIWDKGQQAIGNSTAWGSYASPTAPRFRDRCEAIVWAYKQNPVLDIPKGAPLLIDGDTFRTLAQDYWHVPPASPARHPAVFPAALAENAIRFFGYAGCHVLDPFAGTGSTGVAAKKLNCRASLVEIDAAYCQIAQEQLDEPSFTSG